MTSKLENTGKKLSSNAVCERYGIHRRTLGYWMARPEMGFPKPIALNGRLYFDEAEIREYERLAAVARGRAA